METQNLNGKWKNIWESYLGSLDKSLTKARILTLSQFFKSSPLSPNSRIDIVRCQPSISSYLPLGFLSTIIGSLVPSPLAMFLCVCVLSSSLGT